MKSNKIAIGTAQFGLTYGITNTTGQVIPQEVIKILKIAADHGIDTIDTAISYGNSEECLGKASINRFKVITKLPSTIDRDVAKWVKINIQKSLQNLQVDSIYGLLLHRSQHLTGKHGKTLIHELEKLRTDGVIKKIGVSIYDPIELDKLAQIYQADIIQAPLNLMDRRLISSGWLQKLHDNNVEVHVRSVFLQGLLLLPRKKISLKFKPWSDLFDRWHKWLSDNNKSPLEACITAVLNPMIDRLVIGVDSAEQLEEILRVSSSISNTSLPNLSSGDDKLINPSHWSSL